ncbi:MAG: sigma-70 family RNA polymerase sigma factor [Bacteroidales bacterium]|nr:sigma-70 family RNA polymerase sigma factor [Bacteroidales bacterium]
MDYNKIKRRSSRWFREKLMNVYKSLYRDLCNYAYNIIPDRDIVEDIVQTTFINLWENHKNIGKIEYLKSYLYRCVYNSCLKKFEHDKVVLKFYNEHEYQLKQIQFESFETSYDDDDVMTKLHNALDQLPEKNREVMKLRFIDGLSTNEVSKKP